MEGAGGDINYKKREYEQEKQRQSVYLKNNTLAADDDLLAFNILQPMGGYVEWHVLTNNQLRILEELWEAKNRKQELYPYVLDRELSYKRREYEQEKQRQSAYLSNNTLAADDDLLAFNILQPMGGFVEWHVLTNNQLRILEELREAKIQIQELNPYVQHRDLIYKRREYQQEKHRQSVYLSNNTLAADDDLLAFNILQPTGGFLEWHVITYNQFRILEELWEVKRQIQELMSYVLNRDLSYKRRGYQQEKQRQSVYLSNNTLAADDDLLAFNILQPMGGFLEWHVITYNQLRILGELREVKRQMQKLKSYTAPFRRPQEPTIAVIEDKV